MSLKSARPRRKPAPIHVGTAGWSVAPEVTAASREGLKGLARYAECFDVVEINSTFYRLPRASTLERWRDTTPPHFRFCVKLPGAITHEAALVGVKAELTQFCELVRGLKPKLGAVLVQLPPSLHFEARRAGRFFGQLRGMHAGDIVLEPRHASWFSDGAEALLMRHAVGRVAADPALSPAASEPGAAPSAVYYRWHGSPRMYFSAYEQQQLERLAETLRAASLQPGTRAVYCIFDNTGLGAAGVNARELRQLVAAGAGSS